LISAAVTLHDLLETSHPCHCGALVSSLSGIKFRPSCLTRPIRPLATQLLWLHLGVFAAALWVAIRKCTTTC